MLKKQNNVCAICGLQEKAKTKQGETKKLAVDHNHKTGKVRGLLCHNCNVFIGHAKDNSELLKKAVLYLETNNE